MTGLRPILETRPCAARVLESLGPPQSHFGQRAQERGIASIPGDALRLAVEWAVRHHRADFLEPCRSL